MAEALLREAAAARGLDQVSVASAGTGAWDGAPVAEGAYLVGLGHEPLPLDYWSRRVVQLTLRTDDLAKKLLGMQLTIEQLA